jgi:hypothetical protein
MAALVDDEAIAPVIGAALLFGEDCAREACEYLSAHPGAADVTKRGRKRGSWWPGKT